MAKRPARTRTSEKTPFVRDELFVRAVPSEVGPGELSCAPGRVPSTVPMRFVPLLLAGCDGRSRTRDNTRAIAISDPLQDPRIRTSPVYDGASVALGRNVPVRSGDLAPKDLRENSSSSGR